MYNLNYKFPDTKAYEFVVNRLEERGITINDIAEIAKETQKKFHPSIPLEQYVKNTIDVLHKREILNNAMVGLELDRLATEKKLEQPLQDIIANDASVFGVDEGLALNMANIYGTIGVTNFGFLDKEKTGKIASLDRNSKHINTFIDDIVGAIATAVSAKIAHEYA
ncbi:phosphatidylglycerophosphatase A [Secundilactobacillus oryzae JCM 18671]|uniref:Phosphatidylglycerophosphatase A n=1 Tax=Secundilactobacillus oryzae JCM 18671 TaxID=1291743 RepID=A0A081BID3_9LACO|nr:phosphatidylglycerophosphatase A [Secundilactobacillus oryzae]GAK47801.1 phosphatidylglycerophosphatase A [Secundilactobacillus oryzae JCM 18671]